MGIQFCFLPFFDLCHSREALREPVLALGNQVVQENRKRTRSFARKNAYRIFSEDPSVANLFRDRYQISAYEDAAVNGKARIFMDLNLPIEPERVGSVGTLINGGTLEHIFDIRQVMENVHRLVRVGGTIIHIAPLSWYQHGYFNFNTHFFTSVATANHLRVIAEAFLVSPVSHGRGLSLAGMLLGIPRRWLGVWRRPKLFFTHDGHAENLLLRQRIDRCFKEALPGQVLYFVAHQKTLDTPFAFPSYNVGF